MTPDWAEISSAAAAALFASTFLFGRSVHPLQGIIHDRRVVVSFGAGVSTAYLFIRMMPELSDAQDTLDTAGIIGPWPGVMAYVAALIGFLLIYGRDHFLKGKQASTSDRAMRGVSETGTETEARAFGMVLYVFLLTYVLIQEPASTPLDTMQYAVAISFHFLAVDHALNDELGERYDRRGRFVLAGACLLGWAVGQLVDLPDVAVALLLAFISGGVIVNSAIMELPTERDGRFVPFVFGSLLFGLVLMAV